MSEITLKITGVVCSRPGDGGPPRETIISELNPSREKLIRNHTKWDTLTHGTLNVKLNKKDIDELETLEPCFKEKTVVYPDKYKSIPKRKGGYLYHNATIDGWEVLVRTTIREQGRNIGVVSHCHLKTALNLQDKSSIEITITSKKKIQRPFFFDRHKNQMRFDNIYKDAHVFLIASGPSFKDFPHKNKLRFVQTMAMNNSFKALMPYTRPNMWTAVDGPDKFLYTMWHDPQILKLVHDSNGNKMIWNNDIKLPEEKKVRDVPNVVYYRRGNIFNKKKYLTEDSANWGQNCEYKAENGVNGKRSVMMATIKLLYMLGFRHVYLLGVDFNMDEKNKYSFEQSRKPSSIKGNSSTYKQLEYWFGQLQPIFLENKFYIYNLNPDSKLKAFPYMPFEEAFEQALGFVHDTEKYVNGELEDTRNLYETRVWKCRSCNLWQRAEEEKRKDGEKEYYVSATGCSNCGRIMDTRDKERRA